MNVERSNPDGGLLLGDPLDDPWLEAVPDFIRNRIVEVADAVVAEGRRPTPQLVGRVLAELRWEPVAQEGLEAVLMVHWRFQLDEVDSRDRAALQAHLERAPVADHPWCCYLAGLITGLAVGAAGRGRP